MKRNETELDKQKHNQQIEQHFSHKFQFKKKRTRIPLS